MLVRSSGLSMTDEVNDEEFRSGRELRVAVLGSVKVGGHSEGIDENEGGL